MAKIVSITSTPALCSAYQRLLSADWSKRTLEPVLALLWKEIAPSAASIEPSLRQAINPYRHHLPPDGYVGEVIDEMRHFRRHFHGNGLMPPLPDDFPSRKPARRRAIAEAVWTYMILGNLVPLRGDLGFFADSQSLLFLLAVEFLLPELRDAHDTAECSCLVNALYMHTYIAWTHNPEEQAHHFFLQSVLMDYLGHSRLRHQNLRYSLNLTDLEDHSFLTKVQAYIFGLLDAGNDDEAKQFLLRLYRHAPDNYLPELQEMLDQVLSAPATLAK